MEKLVTINDFLDSNFYSERCSEFNGLYCDLHLIYEIIERCIGHECIGEYDGVTGKDFSMKYFDCFHDEISQYANDDVSIYTSDLMEFLGDSDNWEWIDQAFDNGFEIYEASQLTTLATTAWYLRSEHEISSDLDEVATELVDLINEYIQSLEEKN